MKTIISSVLLIIQLLSGSFDTTQIQLVNKYNPIQKEITLNEMAKMPGTWTYARKEAGDAAAQFVKAIHAAGYKDIRITSGYRTNTYQKQLFDNRVRIFKPLYKEKAEEMATTIVARPGTSEHQVGLAFDISYGTGPKFIGTPASKWMDQNCWKYGFILRYPKGKESITGVSYEPWHFRYVGADLAKFLTVNGLTLEEFYNHLSVVANKTEIQRILKDPNSKKENAMLLQERLNSVHFRDIPYSNPSRDIVHKAVTMNIIKSPHNDSFGPHETLNYKEFLDMLLISSGKMDSDFVKAELESELGIGLDNPEYTWESPVKRSDAPYLICKTLGLADEETSQDIFYDRVGQDNHFVNTAYYAGLFFGTLDKEGKPILGEGNLIKIDAVTICLRVNQYQQLLLQSSLN